ncbi:MAG: hypothetical protein ACQEXB_09375 [Bacillota bacterium]
MILYTSSITLYNPIIPKEKALDFNVSFYAGLISGIITGLLTGLIVGVVLWIIQKQSQKLNDSRFYEGEVSVFMQKLQLTFLLPKTIIMSNKAEDWLPESILEAIKLITNSPIHQWKDHVRGPYSRLVIQATKVVEEYRKYLLFSKNLEELLLIVFKQHENRVNFRDIKVILALINDIDEYTFELKKPTPSVKLPKPTRDLYIDFTNGEKEKQAILAYKEQRKILLNELTVFKELIL